MSVFDLGLILALLASWGYLLYTGSTFKVWRDERRERRIHKLITKRRGRSI